MPVRVPEHGGGADHRESALVVGVVPTCRGVAKTIPQCPADTLKILSEGLDFPDTAVGVEIEGDGLAEDGRSGARAGILDGMPASQADDGGGHANDDQ